MCFNGSENVVLRIEGLTDKWSLFYNIPFPVLFIVISGLITLYKNNTRPLPVNFINWYIK